MKKKSNRILISSLLMTILCVAALTLIATLPGGGWWFGAQVQNVSSTPASITFTTYDFASSTYHYSLSDSIAPMSSKTYTTFSFPGMPDNFQGSSKVNSGQDIRAIVNLTNLPAGSLGDPNSPSPAEGQYQGMNTASTTLHFPLVKNVHYGNTTTIIVQNVGTGSAAASAAFHFPNNYNYTYTTPTLNPGQMAVIEPIDAHSGQAHPPTNDNTNSVGSLTVTSSQLLAGVSLEHRTMEDHATVLKATRGFTNGDGGTTLYAPINKNNYYDRFTGSQVQNISGGSIDVHVTYTAIHDNYCPGGTFYDDYYGLAKDPSQTFSSSKMPNKCFGPAKIVTTGSAVAVVNEEFTSDFLKAYPDHAREDTAYAAFRYGSATSNISAPLFKEDAYSNATGLGVQNIDNNSTAWVVATFKNNNQTFVTYPMDIAHNQAIVLLDMRLLQGNPNPPSWWHGWNGTAMTPALLGCVSGVNGCGANGVFSVTLNSLYGQKIVAIANEVAYPINTPFIPMDEANYQAFNLP